MARHDDSNDHAPRILGGKARGRALATPSGLATRPLRALVRRSLFDILSVRVADARFLDLYAGAGTVGFEAFSRGAREVVLVEQGRAALAALRKSAEILQSADVVRIEPRAVEDFVEDDASGTFDLIFLGPPYPLVRDADPTVFKRVFPALARRLGPSGTVVLESPRGFSPSLEGLSTERFREYGETWIHFMERP
jgi:16S rRNA (guanine966-N2)-methyltransferase